MACRVDETYIEISKAGQPALRVAERRAQIRSVQAISVQHGWANAVPQSRKSRPYRAYLSDLSCL